MSQTTTPPDDARPEPRLFRRAWKRRKRWLILQWLVVSAALMSFAQVQLTEYYDASALVKIVPRMSSDGQIGFNTVDTEVNVITSADVLSAASQAPRLAKLPLLVGKNDVEAELRGMIRV